MYSSELVEVFMGGVMEEEKVVWKRKIVEGKNNT